MSEVKKFSFADVDFSDPESVAAVYGAGGGIWRREEVTILSAYYHPDIFEKRNTTNATPEAGFVFNFHFHNDERRAEVAKRDADKRHWMTSARYGFGRYFFDRGGVLYRADDSVLYRKDDPPIDLATTSDEDLRAEYFSAPPGAVWLNGSFQEFHRSLSQIEVSDPELAAEWKSRYSSGGASSFSGLRCFLAQVDVDIDAKVQAEKLDAIKKRLEAEGATDEEIKRARYYPPTTVYIDEILAVEDTDSLAAYDPNAVVVTPRALDFIKGKIGAGTDKMPDIGMAALNESPDLHPEVMAALDVDVLAKHGINWANQRLTLAT